MITDVRFSPSMLRLATSSLDQTVRVWDLDNPANALRNFTGHSSPVLSLDFHPYREDLVFSNASNGEIRIWSVARGSCQRLSEVATVMVRVQPTAKYLAAASDSFVNIIDLQRLIFIEQLEDHRKKLQSVCWDPSGKFLATLSEDVVRVWNVMFQCVCNLTCDGNIFSSCVFHPKKDVVIVGGYQSLVLSHFLKKDKKTLPYPSQGQITCLAASSTSGIVAFAGHDDNCLKLWFL